MSEVDDIIQDLKKNAGFHSYLILNNDGIVIKYENMSLKTALHFSYHVLGLTQRATSALRTLLQPPDNELETLRLRTNEYELIVTQHGHYTLLAMQLPAEATARSIDSEAVATGEALVKA